MKNNLKNDKKSLLVLIAGLTLCAAGLVFLCLSIFSKGEGTNFLALGSLCVVVSNVINLLYQRGRRKGGDE